MYAPKESGKCSTALRLDVMRQMCGKGGIAMVLML